MKNEFLNETGYKAALLLTLSRNAEQGVSNLALHALGEVSADPLMEQFVLLFGRLGEFIAIVDPDSAEQKIASAVKQYLKVVREKKKQHPNGQIAEEVEMNEVTRLLKRVEELELLEKTAPVRAVIDMYDLGSMTCGNVWSFLQCFVEHHDLPFNDQWIDEVIGIWKEWDAKYHLVGDHHHEYIDRIREVIGMPSSAAEEEQVDVE